MRLGLALTLLTSLLALFTLQAVSAPLAAAAQNCPGTGYPPSVPSATVSVGTTTPRAGSSLTVSGSGYCPNEGVVVTVGGQNVGSARTDGNGDFAINITVPGSAGNQQLCATGATGLADNADCVTLAVQGAAPIEDNNNSNGGPAFTGTRVALLSAVALLLIAGGVAFSTVGRRRKVTSS